ncbi:transcription elongation factor GreA [Mucilaginibacter sp. 14171R-50]|uniref:GreA/GreB family elongation factor n=1 Tax=Mucilaginibacter sp. 14171R-50 TaxID=2703789 RepID=UPI00138C6B58|nr:GreA/GreB family elongation factor [Mucilaginibacter sp. 14171R-50]QHS57744.1 transcription elongation factor GreA [Mucilaginibacter sp. 14171R-50]
MKTQYLIMPAKEHELLKKHCNHGNLSNYNLKKLTDELASASIIPKDQLPDDVVCLSAAIQFKEVLSGKHYAFSIVEPHEADIRQHKMSALAPLSIALLGYRKGALVDWQMPGGIMTFEILDVVQNA